MEKLLKVMKLFWVRHLSAFIPIVPIAIGMISACTGRDEKLPIFGERTANGTDTVFHTIAPFRFVDQDSAAITNESFLGKIYVADFFFTTSDHLPDHENTIGESI